MNHDYEAGFRAGKRDAHKAMERRMAEAVAADRERCAKVYEERRETFADPAYAGGPIGAVSEMFACKACAAAIREGGEHV